MLFCSPSLQIGKMSVLVEYIIAERAPLTQTNHPSHEPLDLEDSVAPPVLLKT